MKKLSVLIIDDNEAENTEKYVREVFDDYKLQISIAKNHAELREKLSLGKYDVAFVDFNLEGGYEADAVRSARILDQSQPECLRIGMTALSAGYGSMDYITNEIYSILIDRWQPMKKLFLRKELKKYGF